METAIVKDANRPTRGSTPAMMEKEMASGINASATTRPARTSVRSILGDRRALRTVGSTAGGGVVVACKDMLRSGISVPGAIAGASSPAEVRFRLYCHVRLELKSVEVRASTVTEQAAPSSPEAATAPDTRDVSPSEAFMHIGEVAARTELSLRSLRHWEEVGLLTPSGRTDGGFRLYTEVDVDRIMVIRRMKPLGFSLDQMKTAMADIENLASPDTDATARELARERLDATQQDAVERRQKLVQQLAMADEFIDLIRGRLI